MTTLRNTDVGIIKYFKAIIKNMLCEAKVNYLKITGKIEVLRRERKWKGMQWKF